MRRIWQKCRNIFEEIQGAKIRIANETPASRCFCYHITLRKFLLVPSVWEAT